MCFHNSIFVKASKLAVRYGKNISVVEIAEKILEEQKYHANAFAFAEYPVITSAPNIQFFNWGLIPSWTKTVKEAQEIRKFTINARSDNVFDRASFSEPILRRRCLIPSTGYFEWRHERDRTIPYFIYLPNEEVFSMAGIYDIWRDKEAGDVFTSFSIITTEANRLTDYIHNTKHRMPVILSKDNEKDWLDPLLSKSDIENLLIPYDADKMDAYIIRNDFLKKVPNDPSILEKVR
ncbi:MAG: SOS response-associated peptidase [Bacteroides sp.]|jgi:putative SOS response-associated peptidase YedK|nr:SOS response-associated peptidase [Bacteroides sp.]MCI1682126.1 SOS response-associated peptidase [Bacteroides sp.]